MQKEYQVIEDYQNSNPDPIEMISGDILCLGERSNENGPWANWIYCISQRTQKEGWVPVQLLEIAGDVGVATADYTAKEMTVAVGDAVDGGHELNGWIWCVRKADLEFGWVPKDNLKCAE
ncbi:MAG: SH3 domain-containing protein [Angelakisella sp.]